MEFFTTYLKESLISAGAFLLLIVLFRFRAPIIQFIGETRVELGKCTWPWDPAQTGIRRYKELIESTVVVIISTVLLAGFVTFWDLVLSIFIGALTGGRIS